MKDNKKLEEKLHHAIIERQSLINEKKTLLKQISFIKAKLLLPENQNKSYAKKLLILNKQLNTTTKKLEISSRILILLFSKLRIVKINLKKDNYLEKIAPTNDKLCEAIEEIECYGCIETGEIFEGPNSKDVDIDIPTASLDKFESTSKKYRKNMNKHN